MCTFAYFHLHWIRQVKKCRTIGKYVMCQSEEYEDWWIKTKQTNPFLLFIGWRLRKRETASSALKFNHQLVSRGWFGENTVSILIKNGQSKCFLKNRILEQYRSWKLFFLKRCFPPDRLLHGDSIHYAPHFITVGQLWVLPKKEIMCWKWWVELNLNCT